MTITRALSTATARTALEDCENKIRTAFRRGLEATRAIAKELHKILSEELYKVKTDDFSEYVTDHLNMDRRSYARIIAISQTLDQLQAAGLQLPANESQAAELARLDVPLRPRIWSELTIRAERDEKTLTADDVRRAVEEVERTLPAQPPAPKQQGTLEISMDDDNGAAPKKVTGTTVRDIQTLTEKGEAALQRIRKICGEEVADGIESGTIPLTEREIRNWAEHDDSTMRSLVFYIVDQRWTITKAINFEAKPIEDSTKVETLLLIAKARGGIAQINYDNAKITVTLAP